MNLKSAIDRLKGAQEPDLDALTELLSLEDPVEMKSLFDAAYDIKRRGVGTVAYFRGIIEFSNICTKNCFYCGIRRDHTINRYSMTKEEILECARFALGSHYGSLVLQCGERDDEAFVDFVSDIVSGIKRVSDDKLGITLSCGEQTEETYGRWFESGAHRYLLRIETSDRDLYTKLHPADHDFDRRTRCLTLLRDCGYQVGTGVMIGLPGQTVTHLARDIIFYREHDIDMIGMGPYVVHEETPIASQVPDSEEDRRGRLDLALKMIASTRIVLEDVNIATATALQSLHPRGREMGLKAGANVVMPNVTPTKYRNDYLLYENKPCVDEGSDMCRGCLTKRVESVGETVGWNQWGDSKHFFARTRKSS